MEVKKIFNQYSIMYALCGLLIISNGVLWWGGIRLKDDLEETKDLLVATEENIQHYYSELEWLKNDQRNSEREIISLRHKESTREFKESMGW